MGRQQRPAAFLGAEAERHRPEAMAAGLERRIIVGDEFETGGEQEPSQRAFAGAAAAAQQRGAVRPGDTGPVQDGQPLARRMAGQDQPTQQLAARDHGAVGGQQVGAVKEQHVARTDTPRREGRHRFGPCACAVRAGVSRTAATRAASCGGHTRSRTCSAPGPRRQTVSTAGGPAGMAARRAAGPAGRGAARSTQVRRTGLDLAEGAGGRNATSWRHRPAASSLLVTTVAQALENRPARSRRRPPPRPLPARPRGPRHRAERIRSAAPPPLSHRAAAS